MSIVGELVGKQDAGDLTRKERKERAAGDFEFFCTAYLPHYFSCAPAAYQNQLYKVINTQKVSPEDAAVLRKYMRSQFAKDIRPIERVRGIIDIEPRDHGKSVRMTFAFPLWCALFGHRKFIALFGNTDTDAKQYLENIKNEIEENELLAEDFGELQGSIWKANLLELSTGSAITSRSKGSSARGLRFHENRPDLVVLDDIIKDEEADSRDQCDKVYRWIKRVVFNLGKNCFIVVVNTHFNDNDPPTVLLREAVKGKLEGYLPLRFSAELEDGTPLWPQRWSEDDLHRKKNDVGSMTYMIEYLSLSIQEGAKIFRPEWIVYTPIAEIDRSRCVFTFGVDPNATGSDDAAIAVCCYDKVKEYRDIVTWWSKPYGSRKEFVEKLFDLYAIWQPLQIGFEEVAFQKIYKEYILEEAMRRGVLLPMIGIKPGGASKKARAMQYQPYVEAGIMRFATSMKDSKEMDEFQAFPTTGVNDGLVDAVYYAVYSSTKIQTNMAGSAARRRNSPLRNVMRRYTYGK